MVMLATRDKRDVTIKGAIYEGLVSDDGMIYACRAGGGLGVCECTGYRPQAVHENFPETVEALCVHLKVLLGVA